jgi:2-oxoglutarate dehydrogenase E1 component
LSGAQKITKAEAPYKSSSVFEGAWKGFRQPHSDADLLEPVKTQVDEATLKSVAAKINAMPAGFHLHSKLARFFDARLKAVQEGKGLDWGNGEALAYATLVAEGHPVRLSGQDAERGTFTHRHSVLNDFETGERYAPFNHVKDKQAPYTVHNSHLSETGVMGFEYGFSLALPQALTIWEAQFGDFANGAQVIIDQFIATSESKWQRMTGLTLLLPHGYEGQGPEHSSARLERFLQLCGKGNLIVANLSTPAQIFHALRRQVKRDFRKPLVIMSPKSLLRNPSAVSSLDEFTQAGFQEVIDDPTAPAGKVKRVLICSGKVYYDLVAERATREKLQDVAIVRIEQLYPWPGPMLAKALARYTSAQEIVWVQEEPRNMGAWTYVHGQWMGGTGDFMKEAGGRAIKYAGRGMASAPAVGSPKVHEAETKAFLEQAFNG